MSNPAQPAIAPDVKPVVEYMQRRLTPDGTREMWGFLCEGVEELPRGTMLYTADALAALSKRIADTTASARAAETRYENECNKTAKQAERIAALEAWEVKARDFVANVIDGKLGHAAQKSIGEALLKETP